MSYHLSDEKRKAIEEMLAAGDSVMGISRKIHSSPMTIAKIRDLIGVAAKKTHRPYISELTRKNIQAMIRFGGTLATIAKVNGVSQKTVYAIRDKMITPETHDAIACQSNNRSTKAVGLASRKERAVYNRRTGKVDHIK